MLPHRTYQNTHLSFNPSLPSPSSSCSSYSRGSPFSTFLGDKKPLVFRCPPSSGRRAQVVERAQSHYGSSILAAGYHAPPPLLTRLASLASPRSARLACLPSRPTTRLTTTALPPPFSAPPNCIQQLSELRFAITTRLLLDYVNLCTFASTIITPPLPLTSSPPPISSACCSSSSFSSSSYSYNSFSSSSSSSSFC
ncbi:hypothetical protein E2C01_085938 [Portunus trituberculatus]|uniref:Uncharacterized protein n=1 Tax=Portunus trituberculatus TaxID=210409 RepID=A0A5B7JF05_PORTR|nr:hypothetical protein [Portunus trituberculatus]